MTDEPRLFIWSGVIPGIAVGAIAANCDAEKLANDFRSMFPNCVASIVVRAEGLKSLISAGLKEENMLGSSPGKSEPEIFDKSYPGGMVNEVGAPGGIVPLIVLLVPT